MGHVLVLHCDADAQAALTLAAHIRADIALPVPLSQVDGRVTFGPAVQVIVLWSRDAAAQYSDLALDAVERRLVHAILLLDGASAPTSLARAPIVEGTGDAGRDAEAVMAALALPVRAPRVAPALASRPKEPDAPPPPAVKGQRAPVTFLAAGGAAGTLAAVALGWAAPSEFFASPAVADPLLRDEVGQTDVSKVRVLTEDALRARFDEVWETNERERVVGRAELAQMMATLADSEAEREAANAWSEQAVRRLDAMSSAVDAPAAPARQTVRPSAPVAQAAAEPIAQAATAVGGPRPLVFAEIEPAPALLVDTTTVTLEPVADIYVPLDPELLLAPITGGGAFDSDGRFTLASLSN